MGPFVQLAVFFPRIPPSFPLQELFGNYFFGWMVLCINTRVTYRLRLNISPLRIRLVSAMA
jgi:hypothetical protein